MARPFHLLAALALVSLVPGVAAADSPPDRADYLIGYTDMRCDDPRGQFYNWRTSRAHVVRADGTGRREIGGALITRENQWTSFGGWWTGGAQAIVSLAWESEENYLWERANKTFRHTQGWLVDACLVDLATGAARNVTAIERVSDYNAGLAPWPGDPARATFAPLINGVQTPFAMDADGRNKRSLASGPAGFTYAANVSPDGRRIAYNKNYLVYIADADGANPRRVNDTPGHTFQFIPTWSPDGQWLLFLSGQHYKCHPHLVCADGTGLLKLADRGAYRSVMEPLKHPDFHSASSDLPAWSPDSRWIYFTAQVGEAVELMRVSLDGAVQQLTRSAAGVAHYHPKVSPDGKLIVFGSTRAGPGAQFVANADGTDIRAVTVPTEGRVHMHAHWQPR